mmetsp:Transcript_8193/g.23089  ORF Transcript_8193/g.23089 Transcript_8193/m.23089 type:complete len:401 (+) Transcript_8193:228-1430(+)
MQTTQVRRRGSATCVLCSSQAAARLSAASAALGRIAASSWSASTRKPLAMRSASRLQSGRGRSFCTSAAAAWPGDSSLLESWWQNCSQKCCERGLRVAVGGGWSRSSRHSMSISDGCTAGRPRRTSRATTPREKTSDACVQGPLSRSAGSMYSGSPTIVSASALAPSSSTLRTQPQPPSFATVPTSLSPSNSNTAALRTSQCVSRCSCSARRPRATPSSSWNPSAGFGGSVRRSSQRVPWPAHGKTSARLGKQTAAACTKFSSRGRMLWARNSRRKRRAASSGLPCAGSFTATGPFAPPVALPDMWPRATVPKPPSTPASPPPSAIMACSCSDVTIWNGRLFPITSSGSQWHCIAAFRRWFSFSKSPSRSSKRLNSIASTTRKRPKMACIIGGQVRGVRA